jgi:hypothetical protein
MTRIGAAFAVVLTLAAIASAQASQRARSLPVPLQPLAQEVHQIENALAYLGQPFSAEEVSRIDDAIADPKESKAVERLQRILDPHVLAIVQINAESRVKVEAGPAAPELLEAGTRLFLVKVINDAGVTARLEVKSPNSGDVYIQSTGDPKPALELTPQQAADRWTDVSLFPPLANSWASISLYQNPPMLPRLSGLAVEYQILSIYSRDAGQRSAIISFNVGQGTQDIGFRNDMTILFTARPARVVTFRVHDENGQPGMASFIVRGVANSTFPIEKGLLQIGLEFRCSDCFAGSQNQAGPALVAGSRREFHGLMEVVIGGVGDHVGNHRQLAFLSRSGLVQPLHRDRHGGVVAHEGALEIGSQVVVLDRWIGQPIPESQRQEKHSREGQEY